MQADNNTPAVAEVRAGSKRPVSGTWLDAHRKRIETLYQTNSLKQVQRILEEEGDLARYVGLTPEPCAPQKYHP
jgi:hypothetical protein